MKGFKLFWQLALIFNIVFMIFFLMLVMLDFAILALGMMIFVELRILRYDIENLKGDNNV